MHAILKQRHLLITKIFELTDNSLKMAIKSPFNYIEEEFPFEEITTKTTLKIKTSLLALLPAFFFISGTLITSISFFSDGKNASSVTDILLYAVPACLFSIYARLRREKTINLLLTDRRILSFYKDSPDNSTVLKFLAQLKKQQKAYLLNRYAKNDLFASAEQLANNLNWLFDREVINSHELDRLRSTLLFKAADPAYSFNFNQN